MLIFFCVIKFFWPCCREEKGKQLADVRDDLESCENELSKVKNEVIGSLLLEPCHHKCLNKPPFVIDDCNALTMAKDAVQNYSLITTQLNFYVHMTVCDMYYFVTVGKISQSQYVHMCLFTHQLANRHVNTNYSIIVTCIFRYLISRIVSGVNKMFLLFC